eukprot:1150897-Pelagomonas_calceolata.AAC.4
MGRLIARQKTSSAWSKHRRSLHTGAACAQVGTQVGECVVGRRDGSDGCDDECLEWEKRKEGEMINQYTSGDKHGNGNITRDMINKAW